MKFAIIDIGSNSVRLMLWADGKTLYKKVTTTRLAAKISEDGLLDSGSIDRTLEAVASFCAEGRREGAEIYAFATAAVRSAKNGEELCRRIFNRCSLSVDVVSGQDEALLGVFGALGTQDGTIIDIGGASTEVCIRKGGETDFLVSIDIGAVRLYEICGEDRQKITSAIKTAILPLKGKICINETYAIGGTASTLASVRMGLSQYNAEKINGIPLEREWIAQTAERFLKMQPEARKNISGMDPARADIISGATFLLSEIMKMLNCEQVKFSDNDNLEGYLIYRGLR